MFDIFVNADFSATPTPSPLVLAIKHDVLIQQHISCICKVNRSFAGLDISLLEAMWLAKIFNKSNISTYVVEAKYRNCPPRSDDEVRSLAKSLLEKSEADFPGHTFTEMEYVESPLPLRLMTYCFKKTSTQLQEEGICPGAIHVLIDKVDLHQWQLSESECIDMERILELTQNR